MSTLDTILAEIVAEAEVVPSLGSLRSHAAESALWDDDVLASDNPAAITLWNNGVTHQQPNPNVAPPSVPEASVAFANFDTTFGSRNQAASPPMSRDSLHQE